MDEDDESVAVAVGQDEVEALAFTGAVGDIGTKALQPGAVIRRPLRPQRRQLVGARDMGRIGVGIVPIALRYFPGGLKALRSGASLPPAEPAS